MKKTLSQNIEVLQIISRNLRLNLSRLRQFRKAKEIMNDMNYKVDLLLFECEIIKSK